MFFSFVYIRPTELRGLSHYSNIHYCNDCTCTTIASNIHVSCYNILLTDCERKDTTILHSLRNTTTLLNSQTYLENMITPTSSASSEIISHVHRSISVSFGVNSSFTLVSLLFLTTSTADDVQPMMAMHRLSQDCKTIAFQWGSAPRKLPLVASHVNKCSTSIRLTSH